MATIWARKYPSGLERYRVCLEHKRRRFTLTFDDYKEGCAWIEKHEAEYKKNPDKYFEWRDRLYYKMQRERKTCMNHIIKPMYRRKSEDVKKV